MSDSFVPKDLTEWTTQARRDDWHMRFVGSDIRCMLAEIERLREVQRWRPIEEAPRIEYRRLWLWQRGRGGYEGWWNDFGSEGQDWQDDADSEPAPTHWQPRPAPPQ